jgi:hypothetical protein
MCVVNFTNPYLSSYNREESDYCLDLQLLMNHVVLICVFHHPVRSGGVSREREARNHRIHRSCWCEHDDALCNGGGDSLQAVMVRQQQLVPIHLVKGRWARCAGAEG